MNMILETLKIIENLNVLRIRTPFGFKDDIGHDKKRDF